MRAKIAVATVSGRAYYKLVSELKERNIPFYSIVPGKPIPRSVKVVLTTEEEKPKIDHPNILTYNVSCEPAEVVNEAIRILQGKRIYDNVTIGVDPGNTFGVAVLCDGTVLKAEDGLTFEMALDEILKALKENPAKNQTVRIGGGVTVLAEELLRRLSRVLPESVNLEIVNEVGTSRPSGEGGRKLSDADSAVMIAERKGQSYPGRENYDSNS
ncbi:hypothetical protein CW702_00285 [Candidatus Bathyarchaeota archaeon]|nr:MAG: hypothetical protein CW702_00285 [Candidatus Bathyarchaeota archaeon]